jgi:hypothetical protein
LARKELDIREIADGLFGIANADHRPTRALASSSPIVRPAAADDQRPPEARSRCGCEWIREVAEMGPDALELFEQQIFERCDCASLVACGVRSTHDAESLLANRDA